MGGEETSAGDALFEWIRLHAIRHVPIDQHTARRRIFNHNDVAVGDVPMQQVECDECVFQRIAHVDEDTRQHRQRFIRSSEQVATERLQ